ncbi:hypothetical protein AMTR_s00072p00080450 [Amborella trichopoda]|uniref:Uncharacterized protein n=1 Tax=Amborella trichopoda TaxID=13333 RepID=W1NPA0_AMBTC|nr:hypothetical protein AMTR_s00072p00080450 [Amborella trichopoda]
MRDIDINYDEVPDDDEDVPEMSLQTSASRRVPRNEVARPKKMRAINDSLDNMVYNLGENHG